MKPCSEFIESAAFSAQVADYLDDDEYASLQIYLSEHPEAGDLVRGSGGVRKLRWALPGIGKSGGARICYYVRPRAGQILMLVIYAKSARASIPSGVLARMRKELEDGQAD